MKAAGGHPGPIGLYDDVVVAGTAIVHGPPQGQGLGTKALAVAEAVCRNAGVRALHLEVERGKDQARRLYEKSGFVEHSRYLLTKPIGGDVDV